MATVFALSLAGTGTAPGAAADQRVCQVTGVAPNDVLNMRAEPHHRSPKVGTVPHNARAVRHLGQWRRVGNSDWLNISYQAHTGWVNKRFLLCWLTPEAAVVAIGKRPVEVLNALKAQDMTRFANYVHPSKGVRFSPYPDVDTATSPTFSATEIKTLWANQAERLWGYYDGSGDPISVTFKCYFETFVYTHDFARATEIGYNHPVQRGNTIDNSREVYPESLVVEYYLPGTDPGGLEWASLQLVFEKVGERWYIVGVIHGQWTT